MATENLPISGLYPLTGALTPNDLLVISQELPEGWQSFNVKLSKFVDLVTASMNESGVFLRKVHTIDDNGLVGTGILTDALGLNWEYLRTQFAPFNVGEGYATLSTRIIAGSGLTGGGDLTANRTIALGVPSTITAVTTNAAAADSHTHAIDKASTSTAGVVKLIDTVTSASLTEAPTARVAKLLNDTKTDKTTSVTAGSGLSGGGDLSANRTIALGNPSTLTETSTNNVSATSHTHAVDKASTTVAGLVKLNDTLVSASVTEAPTAKTVKTLNDNKAEKATQVTAGNGLTGGGDLSISRSISLGMPSTITESTTNSTGATTHSHAIDKASTTVAGVVKLNDSLVSTSISEAATSNAVKTLNDTKANANITIETGFGLMGGGNLTANRRIEIDLTQLDSRYAATGVGGSYVPLTRTVSAGTGLSGGGPLSTNLTFSVNFGTAANTVAAGNDTRIVNGQTAFGWGNHASQNYLKNIVIKPSSGLLGTGLTGSGLELDYNALNAKYLSVNGGTITGDLTITGKLTASGLDTGIPIGTVLWFNCQRSAVPDGWLAMDGQVVNRADFPDLWAMVNAGKLNSISDEIWRNGYTGAPGSWYRGFYTSGSAVAGTFRLPDLNGHATGSLLSPVLRGDAYMTSGYMRGDAIRNITGNAAMADDNAYSNSVSSNAIGGAFYYTGRNFGSDAGGQAIQPIIGFDASRVVPTDNENRPNSVFGIYAVRARGGTTGIPVAGSPATLMANTFNGSQKIVGNLEVTGSVNFNNTTNLPILGSGQRWQDVFANRAVGTTYTNTTGKPIVVNVSTKFAYIRNMNPTITATIDGLDMLIAADNSDQWPMCAGNVIVPAGSTYKITVDSSIIDKWCELR